MCGTCEDEREKLRTRIAELEAECEQLRLERKSIEELCDRQIAELKAKHEDECAEAFQNGVHAGQESV